MTNIKSNLQDIALLENLSNKDTFIHNLHPITKIITTIIYIILVVSLNMYNLSKLIPFFVYIYLLSQLSELTQKFLFKKFMFALPFCLCFGISNIFLNTDIAITLQGFNITYGMISFISIMLKTYLTIASIFILISTTNLRDIYASLEKLKVPNIFITQLNLTYRYISTLINEADTMYTSYKLKDVNSKGIRLKYIGSFLGSLLLRSMNKANKIYIAMKLRGYNGKYEYMKNYHFSYKDTIYMIFTILILCIFKIYNIPVMIGNLFI